MKSPVLALLIVLSVAVLKSEGGQVKSVCILIPSYNAEDFAEGEHEEEEVTGWGPGPAKSNVHTGHSGGADRQAIVTHTEEENEDDGGQALQGQPPSTIPDQAGGGAGQGGMSDPTKPPGPNPRWGYWEWDAEKRSWKMEDFRRRRREAPRSVLPGKLQCPAGTIIHVDKVSLGFSINNRCAPVRPSCQATSTIGRQVAHCEGATGTCEVSVIQKFMQLCGRWTNYAKITYECMEEKEVHNICESRTFQTTESVVLASPSFITRDAQPSFLSCECEVDSEDDTELSIPWMKTRLDDGTEGVCGDEMLLLDVWEDTSKSFSLDGEICGELSQRDKTFDTSKVKLTYIPSSTFKASNGFLLKIKDKEGGDDHLKITCVTVSADGDPTPGDLAPPPVPAAPTPSPQEAAGVKPKLPFNFDIKNYPHLMNRTLAAWRARQAGQLGADNSAIPPPGFAGAIIQQGGQPNNVGDEQFDVSGISGTLSAVVASLSSIIVIMGSLGLFLWYRRRQKRKEQEKTYFHRRSSMRSDATLYAEVTYLDPAGPGSGIPTAPKPPAPPLSTPAPPLSTPAPPLSTPAPPLSKPAKAPAKVAAPDSKVYENEKQEESTQKSAAASVADGKKAKADPDSGKPAPPPQLPTRPPRRKKERCRHLSSRKEEQVIYDNPDNQWESSPSEESDGQVKLVLEQNHASLEEISKALGLDMTCSSSDSESTQEVEMQTEA